MIHPALYALTLLLAILATLIWGKIRYDIVAVSALFVAVLIGIVPPHEFFSGLAQSAVTTVAAVMILSRAISQGGLIEKAMDRLLRLHPSFHVQFLLLCLMTIILSGFMNNIGALSLAMPMTLSLCTKHERPPSIALMPIAICASLGGLGTLIGTPPNLIISEFRSETLGIPFHFFDFSWVSLPIIGVCFLFIVLVGWRLMPTERKGKSNSLHFDIQDYLAEVEVPEGASIVGKTIRQIEDETRSDSIIIGFIRNDIKHSTVNPTQRIRSGDILIIEASPDEIKQFLFDTHCHLHDSDKNELEHAETTGFIEVVVPPNAFLEGYSSRQVHLRTRFRLTLLAISRQGQAIRERLHKTRLKAGDVLLMQGPQESLKDATSHLGLLPLQERNIQLLNRKQCVLPLLFFIIAIVLCSLHVLPPSISFAGAIIACVLTRSISMHRVYEYIDWPVITLLAALIPIGQALQHSGGTELIGHWLFSITEHMSPVLLIALIMFVTMTLSDVMNNAATAVIMAPVAISISQALGVSPDPLLMSVAIGASCSFLTPIGHQNSILIMGPGGYRFSDYMRLGLPIEIITLLLASPLICWVWPMTRAIS